VEGTLLRFAEETMLLESSEDLLDLALMISHVFGVDKDVVEVDDDTDVEHIAEDVVHEVLECGWRISEAERHDKVFEMTVAGAEGGFPLIAFFDAEKVITRSQIELGEVFGSLEPIHDLVREGKRVAVLDGDGVETPVVHAEAERSVLFLDEHDRSPSRGFGISDESFVLHLHEIVFKGLKLAGGQREDTTMGRLFSWFQVDSAVIRSVWRELVSPLLLEERDEVVILEGDQFLHRFLIFDLLGCDVGGVRVRGTDVYQEGLIVMSDHVECGRVDDGDRRSLKFGCLGFSSDGFLGNGFHRDRGIFGMRVAAAIESESSRDPVDGRIVIG
jgi:hypothetical protein